MHTWQSDWAPFIRRGTKSRECRPYDPTVQVGDIIKWIDQRGKFYTRVMRITRYSDIDHATSERIYPGLRSWDAVIEYFRTWALGYDVMVVRMERVAICGSGQ